MQQVKQCEVAWHTYKLDQYNVANAKDMQDVLDLNIYEVIRLIETALVKGFVDHNNYRILAIPVVQSLSEYGVNFAINVRLFLLNEGVN